MSLTDLLTQTATEAGCEQPQECRQKMSEAASLRGSMIEALLDSNLVDEDRFMEKLGGRLNLKFVPDEQLEGADSLHSRFPAKLALRYRIYPASLNGAEMTLLTYDPFNLDARQAVGHEVRKRITWGLATRRRILEALHQGYGVGAENFEELLEGREGDAGQRRHEAGDHRARRAGRGGHGDELREPDLPRGAQGTRHGHPRGAAGARPAHPLPHRRQAA